MMMKYAIRCLTTRTGREAGKTNKPQSARRKEAPSADTHRGCGWPLGLANAAPRCRSEGAVGRQILTLPLLAARLAGGFIAPATQEILYPAIRQALEAGGYEDIDKVSELPGMPVAALSALRDWWDMEVPASLPDNARLRDFMLLERRVRGALPPGMLSL
jgi:hypothetical protein